MKCPHCNSPGKVLSTRSALDGMATRRRHQCDADPTHRWNTVEIYEAAFNSAKADIEKWIRRAPKRRARVEKDGRIDQMKADRLAGMRCQDIATKYTISLHMARYWTKMPRARLYPGAKAAA